MTDDKGSGSGSAAGSEGAEGGKNKAAKMSMDQAYAYIEKLEAEKKAQADTIVDLTELLDEANKVLDSQEKGKLIGEILPRSTFKMEDLVGKSADELKSIRVTLDQAMAPKVNSVRFGVHGADLSDREKNLTVGDMSWSTAQKRAGKA